MRAGVTRRARVRIEVHAAREDKMIVGMHHVALAVDDLDAACGFYSEHLGFEVVERFAWNRDNPTIDRAIGLPGSAARGVMLKTSNAFIELWQYDAPAPRDRRADPYDLGYTHLCLQVRDIGDEHARLTQAGMTFVGPPVDFGEAAAIYGRDPFGNVIELYELKSPDRAQLIGAATS